MSHQFRVTFLVNNVQELFIGLIFPNPKPPTHYFIKHLQLVNVNLAIVQLLWIFNFSHKTSKWTKQHANIVPISLAKRSHWNIIWCASMTRFHFFTAAHLNIDILISGLISIFIKCRMWRIFAQRITYNSNLQAKFALQIVEFVSRASTQHYYQDGDHCVEQEHNT